jgi:hypothetical protein
VLLTGPNRLDLAISLQQRFERGLIRIRKGDARLRADLRAIKRAGSDTGGVRIVNEGEVHADHFWALALASRGADMPFQEFGYHSAKPRRRRRCQRASAAVAPACGRTTTTTSRLAARAGASAPAAPGKDEHGRISPRQADKRPTPSTPPALVDHLGRPLRAEEMTGRGRRADDVGRPLDRLRPPGPGPDARAARQPVARLEQGDATAYLELAEEMEEKDLHYLSVLGTRKRAISQLPIEVDAASDDPDDEADAQLIRDWLKRDTLEIELFDILDAIGKGFSVTEIVWEFTAKAWLPCRLKWRDPRWFEFDQVDGETLKLKGLGGPRAARRLQVSSPTSTRRSRAADPRRSRPAGRLGVPVQELRDQGLGHVPRRLRHAAARRQI